MSSSAENVASPDGPDKEKKRRKQLKRMGKLLSLAWEASDAVFQDAADAGKEREGCVHYLADIGQKLDNDAYRFGKHGWEDFCRDLGGVYNRHIQKKTKRADLAQATLDKILPLLPADWLQQIAAKHVPPSSATKAKGSNQSGSSKKRPAGSMSSPHAAAASSMSPARKKNKTKELADREDRSMEQLRNFIADRGGSIRLVEGFTCRVTKKGASSGGAAAYNVSFYNAEGRRFKSMAEVGRHLELHGPDASGSNSKARGSIKNHSIRRQAASKETETEKKNLRKELDRLRKLLKTASKALDAHASTAADDGGETSDLQKSGDADEDLMDDLIGADDNITKLNSAGARVPDIDGFPLLPQYCIPDVLMAWDFLCTFSRALSLTPIALDDFAAALVYKPPEGQIGDDVAAPPVFLAEAHIGLLKLLLQDSYSDDWWWSTLETVEEESPDFLESDLDGTPVIRVDIAALLSEAEDPLITTSWLKSLEPVGKALTQPEPVKAAIKTALGVVSNKWVHAYLRKALEGNTSSDPKFMVRAVSFLVKCVREARLDLLDRNVRQEKLQKAKETVIQEAVEQMARLDAAAPVVTSDEALSDVEYESEDSDDEGDENIDKQRKLPENRGDVDLQDETQKASSVIPPRPAPSIVDLLLPPSKPGPNSEYINAFSWSAIVGATAHRLLHRKKRLLNEVDDYLRSQRELKPLNVAERRDREQVAASRVLTECENISNGDSPTDKAIQHLCLGGHYLQLSSVERLCLLRLFMEAAYDSSRLYEVVNGNIKQRQSAMKALEVEQRRAKREEKEKVIADVAAARNRLASEAREKFIDEKREEIRKLNDKSKEFSDEVIESLTEEDIVEFDEDIKADFLALPTPDSFSKAEVADMVARMQEEAAFDCDSLRVLTMEELVDREARELEELEGQLAGFGGEDALMDPTLDRETIRSIERLRKDIEKTKEQAEKIPLLRDKAIEQLRDAIQDGTIKVLRSALTAARRAKLSGSDEETGGIWAVDLVRNAALELDRAKANKRVMDAQRDLLIKRNKCFIKTEPLGTDRFANRFWKFDNDEDGHFWVETEYSLDGSNRATQTSPGFIDLQKSASDIAIGASEFEEDFMGSEECSHTDAFLLFSRREHHSNGLSATLMQRHWGCQATEESLRAVIKSLNSRLRKENALKMILKESLEHTVGNDEKPEMSDAGGTMDDVALENVEPALDSAEVETTEEQSSGDSEAFKNAKDAATPQGTVSSERFSLQILQQLETAIGQKVRIRSAIDTGTKDQTMARYENGKVIGWKNIPEEVEVPSMIDDSDKDDETFSEPQTVTLEVPYWKASTDRGHTVWMKGETLIESICRFQKWSSNKGYFEDDAAFFAYRNQLGRYLGKPNEAAYSCSPNYFAAYMVRRENELYSKLKIRSYDNNWGGKSGARALWTNSMKDYAYDFQTVQQGLLTLENAFFELTGEFNEYENTLNEEPDAKALLADPLTRIDIELETIDKSTPGLWNSKTSRQVFIEIVSSCQTTGILALCLDLLCRNTTKFLQKHKLLDSKSDKESFDAGGEFAFYDEASLSRRTRGMNLWQRQKKVVNYEEFF